MARRPFQSGLNAPHTGIAGPAAAPAASSSTSAPAQRESGQHPSDVIALVVLWRLRYKLSLRDLPEMFLIRGIVFSYEAVRDWEAKLTPALAKGLRRRRRGKAVGAVTSTRPISRCTDSGAISIAPLTATAGWST